MVSDAQLNLPAIKQRLDDLLQKINLDKLKSELAPLEVEAGKPDLWLDEDNAKKVMSELAGIRDTITSIEKLNSDYQSLEELVTLAKESDDESLDKEIIILKEVLSKQLEQLEILTYLSGEYDSSEAIFSIHSGQGGTEAMDWASMLSRMYTRYFEKKSWNYETIEYSAGEEACPFRFWFFKK